jgi:DNA-binding MarR family transcriptional regulator
MNLDEELIKTEAFKAKSWGKIISHLKREFDYWATNEIEKHGFKGFKMAYMPVFMSIAPEGISNNELAVKAKVTKQAMSKVVRELHRLGYIKTQVHKKDNRSIMISLTEKGKKLAVNARISVMGLTAQFENLVGEKRYKLLTNDLLKILVFQESRRAL